MPRFGLEQGKMVSNAAAEAEVGPKENVLPIGQLSTRQIE